MRFIFKLALGMIIFNAMLIMLGQYFPAHGTISAIDPTVEGNTTKYKAVQKLDVASMVVDFASIFGTTLGTVTLIGILAKWLAGYTIPIGPFIGASIVISLFMSLWSGFTSPLVGISTDMGLLNWYNLFMILFGIILLMSVAEIFTGKGDIDA